MLLIYPTSVSHQGYSVKSKSFSFAKIIYWIKFSSLSFGSAAETYEAAASVQNWSGQQLIKGLENVPCVNSILDLGCEQAPIVATQRNISSGIGIGY